MSLTADRILTTEQVADLLHQTPAWVRAKSRDGVLPARKLGKGWRYDRDELTAWWERGCKPK